jgi:hypothetical protein
VRIYDIPWNKQTDATGRKLGSQLGKVEWVDVDTAKNEFNDFLRVCIALPLNRRLKTKITTTVKGKPGEQVYLIRYERVPHFCFHCGFIGHDKKMCEKRNRGTPSSNYDATLRCSPHKKYEKRAVTATAGPVLKRGLNFNSPTGSANSTSLGKPSEQRAASNGQGAAYTVEIPEMVGAKYGFEEEEKSTGAAEEQDLAARMERVQMQQEQELAWERQNIDEAIAHVQMQQQYLQRRYSGRELSAEVQQQATTLESELQRLMGIKSEVEAANHVSPMDLGKDDMIPAIRDLSGLEVSFGSASDVSMTAGDSVLGKRSAADKHEQTEQDMNLALSLKVKDSVGGQQKKGRTQGLEERAASDNKTRESKMVPTGHGKQARSFVWSRQQK